MRHLVGAHHFAAAGDCWGSRGGSGSRSVRGAQAAAGTGEMLGLVVAVGEEDIRHTSRGSHGARREGGTEGSGRRRGDGEGRGTGVSLRVVAPQGERKERGKERAALHHDEKNERLKSVKILEKTK